MRKFDRYTVIRTDRPDREKFKRGCELLLELVLEGRGEGERQSGNVDCSPLNALHGGTDRANGID